MRLTAGQRERLLSRLAIDPSGCLLWTGAKSTGGYAVIRINGRLRYAHRLMYEMFAGPVPEGLQLDHLCRVHHCANPAHLEPVTSRENSLRGTGIPARNAAKTHCPAKHPYDEANTYRRHGRRYCRTCLRDAKARQAS